MVASGAVMYPEYITAPPLDMDTLERRAMLLLYRKAIRCVGMGHKKISKNKKLSATRARDSRTPVGPTPPPSLPADQPKALLRKTTHGPFA